MVGVCLVTYNQESYIAQAIDSVLTQKTFSEKVHLYIGNDCSTDNTTRICEDYVKRYPDRITLINNGHNLGLVNNTLQVLTIIKDDKCDFVAMLDGDDYWCDPQKIQKQLDLLGGSPDIGFVHTKVNCLFNNKLIDHHGNYTPPVGNVFHEMGRFSIGNCSVLYRSCLLDIVSFDELASEGFLSLDGVMYTLFSAHTQFGYLNEVTAIWRRGHSSVSNTNDEQKQIAYLENEKKVWSYLDRKFHGQFGFNEQSWQNTYNYKVFNIAFAFDDYPLAHSLSRETMITKNPKLFAKRICASNKILFKLWCFAKKKRFAYSNSH